ncbi:Secondary metabolism regulator LAE1 [Hypsizygus marmoreus]|uniref:Secondary metabolism regulator LAE1 n=1 Tax=Hypsizygus marmoreus TaxID=39966 RepID=A0A369JGW0_HYPMA|nr:Secondary metabolism regulator LAE1 [Hypsizygus marmoreus]
MSPNILEPDISYIGDDDSEFFRTVHGRSLNALNSRYMLPVDQDEVKRSELHHRLLQFVFNGRNYIGPVKEALQFGQRRRVLDLGTGGGFWAISMADDFPRAEVIGIDLAPIQPRTVPPNCTFELCDLDQGSIPYPDSHFDFIHARSMHTGIHDYPRFLQEIGRLLRPGGLFLLVEPDLIPIADGKPATQHPHGTGPRGWFTLWETYRACLKIQGIDVTVPQRLAELLAEAGVFERIVLQDGNIPVGFWPDDPHLLTAGQLQWMDYELFLPALKPLFLSSGIAEAKVNRIIADAQQDLYYPSLSTSAQLHIVYGSKCL